MGRSNLSKPVSLRISPEVREKVKKIADETGLLQAQVFDTILQAGCKALDEVKDENITFPLPLRFKLLK
jgi:predicted DNA-binding protein